MVTQDVIDEIYKKYRRAPHDPAELRIPYFLDLLRPNHDLHCENDEIVNHNLDDYNPFRRFLIRRLTGIIEFDSVVAFAFARHIIFFDKNGKNMHVNFKPERKGFFASLFGRRD